MEQIATFGKSVSSPVKLTEIDKERIGHSFAAQVTIPTLVLTGHYDGLNTPAEGRRVAKSLPNAQFYEIANAGHIAFFENPNEVFRLIDDFIK